MRHGADVRGYMHWCFTDNFEYDLAGAPCAHVLTEAGVVVAVGTGRFASAERGDALLQAIVIGQEPTAAARRLAESFATVSAEQLLDSPFVLLARDPSHAAQIIADRRERFGFDSVMTHQPFLDELGRLIAAHHG